MNNRNLVARSSAPRIIYAAALTTLLLSAGCGGAPSPVTAAGTATLDGQPLADGTIEMIPEAGTPGPSATVKIVQGKFDIPAAAKLQAGKFRVEISAERAQGKQKSMNIATGKEEEIESYVSIVPERYNRSSELTAELSPTGRNDLRFELKSK